MKIGEAAKQAQVNVQTFRFYERRGLLKKVSRLASGYRTYSENDVRLVRFIKQWQELGYTLDEIHQLLELRENKIGNAAEVRALTEAKIKSIETRIENLEKMRDELKEILAECPCDAELQPICPTLETGFSDER